MVTLRRARRPLAIVCIAVVALSVLVPGAAALELAPPSPEYVLLAPLEPLGLVLDASQSAEHPEALRTSLPERAPPAIA